MTPGERALVAVRLMRLDPMGLGGLWLRARPGPARDAVLACLHIKRAARIHPGMDDDALFGGIDLAATLGAGALRHRAGIIGRSETLCLAMAERCPPGLAARLGQAIDAGQCGLVAIDEGAEEGEALPAALAERLGLFVSLDGVSRADIPTGSVIEDGAARERLPAIRLDDHKLARLTVAAAELGIASFRAPLLAARAARGLAALEGREAVGEADLALAANLVFAHRAGPQEEPDPAEDREETEEPSEHSPQRPEDSLPPEDVLVEAVRAALPADVLSRLAAGRAVTAASGGRGSGAARRGNRRGRPLPARPGRGSDARIDIVATLRAAAPWQTIRRRDAESHRLVHVRPGDIRRKRFEETSDRLVIFLVDASGSAAASRLAEAKGAVELMLAEAYSRRDHVALIGFRGENAELLLPPTRSLVQTKRRLAALPGGGGTPLAAALRAGAELGLRQRGQGYAPSLAILTDGRANITLDGRADRQAAGEEARQAAVLIAASGITGIVVDTGRRPSRELAELAQAMAVPYLPLPRATAEALSGVVSSALARP
ncbi:protoporphyrin IX magnesium-chelatase [Palleronia aestuarii]|uniref:Protoporphyrin IX magnesium-chelatase n=1 Tax=Palleronia aestuarii TaxID=568105 RepID=A0A2W7NEQ0_9RHOB|nr:magnesium chelatase subunit D [Palleronia aestuarii]PZX18911.1 protoporphyrin IX magnesium-chelatase [Palleronia aestuarii]